MGEDQKTWNEVLNRLDKEKQKFCKTKLLYDEVVDVVKENNRKLTIGYDLVTNVKKNDEDLNENCKKYLEDEEKRYHTLSNEIEKTYETKIELIKSECAKKEKEQQNELKDKKNQEEMRIASAKKDKEEILQEAKNVIHMNEEKLKEIDNKLKQVSQEETQILSFQKNIEHQYQNISKNPRFIEEFKDNHIVAKEATAQKYNMLSDNEVITIAKELNENRYF